jgi:hypothetical protein
VLKADTLLVSASRPERRETVVFLLPIIDPLRGSRDPGQPK